MASGRFVSLDAARGLGACCVVMWHWSHFFDHGVQPVSAPLPPRPLFDQLYWLYSYGWMGVDFFFVLSGFIFCHFYLDSIARRRVGPAEFFRRRFARLYPLHAATLVAVVVLQRVYLGTHGTTFVYPPGSAADLLQAVTLTSHWWPNQSFLFNGPSWSISVECFLYTLFFSCARYFSSYRLMMFVSLAVVGLPLELLHWPIGRGMVAFFSGALVGLGLQSLIRTTWFTQAPWRVLLVALGLGAGLLLCLASLPSAIGMLGRIAATSPRLVAAASEHFVTMAMFPYLVFLLAVIETLRPVRARALRFLGDCSYSIYLLHFPLQLVTVLCLDGLGVGRDVFSRPATFAAWSLMLVGVAALSYYGFERPWQRRIRALGGGIGVQPSATAS